MKAFAVKTWILAKMIINLTRNLPPNVQYNAETMRFTRIASPPPPPPPSFTPGDWAGLEFREMVVAFGTDGNDISASYHDSDNVTRFVSNDEPPPWIPETVATAVTGIANLVWDQRANGAAAFQVTLDFLGSIRHLPL